MANTKPSSRPKLSRAGCTEWRWEAASKLWHSERCSHFMRVARSCRNLIANAFNSMFCRKLLPSLAEITPPGTTYATNTYARDSPKLLYTMADGTTVIVDSARVVQQGCNIGPLGYSLGFIPLMKRLKDSPPVPGEQMCAFVDRLPFFLHPALAHDISAIAAIIEWLERNLQQAGVTLNSHKSKITIAEGKHAEVLTESQREELDRTGLAVAGEDMRIVGVPVGTEEYQQKIATAEAAQGEGAHLLWDCLNVRCAGQLPDSPPVGLSPAPHIFSALSLQESMRPPHGSWTLLSNGR